jgi:hypothetical protein
VIDLSDIDADVHNTGNQAFRLNQGGLQGGLTYFQSGGNTIIRGNTDSDLAPELEIAVLGQHSFTESDFVL